MEAISLNVNSLFAVGSPSTFPLLLVHEEIQYGGYLSAQLWLGDIGLCLTGLYGAAYAYFLFDFQIFIKRLS